MMRHTRLGSLRPGGSGFPEGYVTCLGGRRNDRPGNPLGQNDADSSDP